MSTKYKHSHEVPTAVLAKRLDELSDVMGYPGKERDRELTQRIPAELDRDADLVLSEAAQRMLKMEAERDALAAHLEQIREAFLPGNDGTDGGRLLAIGYVLNQSPTTSLARLKATARAEAMEWAAEKAAPSVAPW